MDFTRKKFSELLTQLKSSGYEFVTYSEYCTDTPRGRFVIIRNDVDQRPNYSLATAQIEYELGVRAVYYFRAVPQSWDEKVIREIAQMGHEIGYHYESLTTCNGDFEAAYGDFCKNLERLRTLADVQTICMHGSPRSPYDSKDLWKHYDFKELGIVGEPYLTTDFSNMLYLTDTGRRWDGYKVSIRDKIEKWHKIWKDKGWVFHSTDDIIRALQENRLPEQLMITTHPQRWTDSWIVWTQELLDQNVKNIVKRILLVGSYPKKSQRK